MIEAADNILELVGNTPLLESQTLSEDVKANIYLKLEYLNPGSSVKDRPAIQIIEDAEQEGKLEPGGTIVEATSGNTGMGLALAGVVKGYPCVLVMPDKMSDEKVKALEAFGARVVQTRTDVEPDHPESYYSVADRIANEDPRNFLANQYHNPSNPKAHYKTTGPEIWEQTDGEIDVFIAAMGTGGTITGTAKYLKEQDPDIKVVGVDPVGSLYYDYFKTGQKTEAHSYHVEGFGEDIIPTTIDFEYIDEVVRVNDRECFQRTRDLVRKEGVFTGGSAGGIMEGALKYARRTDRDENIVCIMCDSASRYLSKIFDDEWMSDHKFDRPKYTEATVGEVLSAKSQSHPTLQSSQTVQEALELFEEHPCEFVPIIDERERIAGVLRQQGLLSHALDSATREDSVGELASNDYIVVDPEDDVDLLGEYFEKDRAVFAIENKTFAGVVTKTDFIEQIT